MAALARCGERIGRRSAISPGEEVVAIFRVFEFDGTSRIVIIIEEQLAGDDVRIAEKSCDQAISSGKRVHIFLRNVSVVDEAGAALLRRLAPAGCRLHATGVHNSHTVRTLQSASPRWGKMAGTGGPMPARLRNNR